VCRKVEGIYQLLCMLMDYEKKYIIHLEDLASDDDASDDEEEDEDELDSDTDDELEDDDEDEEEEENPA
jgi:hypothetical protein